MLELKNVCFEVDSATRKDILKDINLTIEDNKFIAITGPNGGGKSTLAKIIVELKNLLQDKSYLMALILQR